jgi:protocatechuate 3,4-dioxygenase beta subunit
VRDHDDYGGLHRDLHATSEVRSRYLTRRSLLRTLGIAGPATLIGCTGSSSTSPTPMDTAASTTPATPASACNAAPSETEGPYPGDGSNGPNVLGTSSIVRSDIRSSFGGLSGTADGVALTIALTFVSKSSCAPLAGRAIYIWHCTRTGLYSLYSAGATSQNYLRGVQATDANGIVSFTSIFPGCYSGRWPHIHIEVYPNVATATSAANKQATTQIALPKTACDLVYATAGYASSVTNLAQVSLATDMVFSDGASLELATVTGSVDAGMTAAITFAV